MAILTMPDQGSFDQWKQLYNQLAASVGDKANLTTSSTTDLVSAINSIKTILDNGNLDGVVFSIVMNS